VTMISGALDALERQQVILLGYELSLKGPSRILLYLMGMGGMVFDAHLGFTWSCQSGAYRSGMP